MSPRRPHWCTKQWNGHFHQNKILWGLNSFFMFKLSLDPRHQLHSCWQSKRKRSISTEIWLALLTDQKHFNPFIFYKKQTPKSQFKSRKVVINAYHIEQLIGKTKTLHVHRVCTFRCHHCTTTKRKCKFHVLWRTSTSMFLSVLLNILNSMNRVSCNMQTR